jgi:hypothetical protein
VNDSYAIYMLLFMLLLAGAPLAQLGSLPEHQGGPRLRLPYLSTRLIGGFDPSRIPAPGDPNAGLA